MVMKAMLIGLLVIGAVAILETDAYHCPPGVGCRWLCSPKDKDLEKVAADYKKYEAGAVLIIQYFDRPMNSKEHDRMSHEMDDMRERLIQHGVQPDSIRELMLEGYPPKACERRGQKINDNLFSPLVVHLR
jgi:hypothetical protein